MHSYIFFKLNIYILVFTLKLFGVSIYIALILRLINLKDASDNYRYIYSYFVFDKPQGCIKYTLGLCLINQRDELDMHLFSLANLTDAFCGHLKVATVVWISCWSVPCWFSRSLWENMPKQVGERVSSTQISYYMSCRVNKCYTNFESHLLTSNFFEAVSKSNSRKSDGYWKPVDKHLVRFFIIFIWHDHLPVCLSLKHLPTLVF